MGVEVIQKKTNARQFVGRSCFYRLLPLVDVGIILFFFVRPL